MIIGGILEEMMGKNSEFERVFALIPVDVSEQVNELAKLMGVPTSRLLAELVSVSIKDARSEWDHLVESKPKREEYPAAPLNHIPDFVIVE